MTTNKRTPGRSWAQRVRAAAKAGRVVRLSAAEVKELAGFRHVRQRANDDDYRDTLSPDWVNTPWEIRDERGYRPVFTPHPSGEPMQLECSVRLTTICQKIMADQKLSWRYWCDLSENGAARLRGFGKKTQRELDSWMEGLQLEAPWSRKLWHNAYHNPDLLGPVFGWWYNATWRQRYQYVFVPIRGTQSETGRWVDPCRLKNPFYPLAQQPVLALFDNGVSWYGLAEMNQDQAQAVTEALDAPYWLSRRHRLETMTALHAFLADAVFAPAWTVEDLQLPEDPEDD